MGEDPMVGLMQQRHVGEGRNAASLLGRGRIGSYHPIQIQTMNPLCSASNFLALCKGNQRNSIPLRIALAYCSVGLVLADGPAPIDLGSAAHFTILAGAAITTTGGGMINGDIGASPISGTAIHLTQAQVAGHIYAVDAAGPSGSIIDAALLLTAKGDLTTAYNAAAGRTPVPSGPFLNPGAGNIGGLNLVPGLYKFTSTTLITGSNLTLTGGADDVWIFQCAADLQLGSGIQILLAGGAQARNIFWQVGTSAVIGTFASFQGTIMADQTITMGTSSTMNGRALAFTAGVTFNGNSGVLPTPQNPCFTAVSRTSAGAVSVTVRTTPYFKLILQTSTDMDTDPWTTITTDTPSVDTWSYTHPAILAAGPRRFYRAYLTNF